ncbi:Protein of unknown function [Mesorhizobium albiziae]|uniref:DUF982 domain-containing protein n=2 Tax=Neomesorhizobium albiziae TaxID=335020 RepID=A0A1I4D0E4_9HYPH|nr:hypothetical protein GCM10007937_01240 [Mesorhizobium albiziae]SFK86169.1 Protein of unknown function [Mesorhizobium albiziae]
MTHERLFHAPVSVSVELGLRRDIESIAEAQKLLAEWYESRRGPLHEAAVQACNFAANGYVTTDQARSALVAFAEATGILPPDVDHVIAAHAVARSYDGFAS